MKGDPFRLFIEFANNSELEVDNIYSDTGKLTCMSDCVKAVLHIKDDYPLNRVKGIRLFDDSYNLLSQQSESLTRLLFRK